MKLLGTERENFKIKISFDEFREEDVGFDNNDTTGFIEIIKIRCEPELPKLSSSCREICVKENIPSVNVHRIDLESRNIWAKYAFEKCLKYYIEILIILILVQKYCIGHHASD